MPRVPRGGGLRPLWPGPTGPRRLCRAVRRPAGLRVRWPRQAAPRARGRRAHLLLLRQRLRAQRRGRLRRPAAQDRSRRRHAIRRPRLPRATRRQRGPPLPLRPRQSGHDASDAEPRFERAAPRPRLRRRQARALRGTLGGSTGRPRRRPFLSRWRQGQRRSGAGRPATAAVPQAQLPCGVLARRPRAPRRERCARSSARGSSRPGEGRPAARLYPRDGVVAAGRVSAGCQSLGTTPRRARPDRPRTRGPAQERSLERDPQP